MQLRAKSAGLALGVLFAFGSAPRLGAEIPALVAPAAIDSPSVVLTIGTHEVTRHALEMNLQRFTGPRLQQNRPASPGEIRQWFEGFLVRQVVVAEALAQGFGQRSEVAAAVERMERHMLTQVEGPLYQTLLGNLEVTPARVDELYARAGSVPRVVVARIPIERAALLASPEWVAADDDGRTELLRRLEQDDGAATFFQGPLPWPFEPFPELEEVLVGAEPGQWLQRKANGLVTVALVRGSEVLERPALAQMRGSFTRFVCHRERLRLRGERGRRVLAATEFAARIDTAMRLAAALRTLPPTDAEIAVDAVAAMETEELALYRDDGRPVPITVAQWRTYYNRLMERSLPCTAAAVVSSVQDLVVAEFDLREARARGLDGTVAFVENRRNFQSMQVLDLFEREKLLPAIIVSEDQIRAHYVAHKSEYSQPVGARGRLHEFPDVAAARGWLRRHGPGPGSEAVTGDPAGGREIVVTAEQPLPGAANATSMLLRLPNGRDFGPVTLADGRVVVFEKMETMRQELLLEQVIEVIRERIARDRLLPEERRLAAEWSRHLAVRDVIPYERLGVAPSPDRPWAATGTAGGSARGDAP